MFGFKKKITINIWVLFFIMPFFVFSQTEEKNQNNEKLIKIEKDVNVNSRKTKVFELNEKVELIEKSIIQQTSPELNVEKNIQSNESNNIAKPDSIKAKKLIPRKNKVNYSKQSKIELMKFPSDQSGTPKSILGADGICSATVIPVNGTCVDNNTNVGSTPDYYGGCIQSGRSSVWFQFTVTIPNDWVNISFNDLAPASREMQVMLFQGLCTDPTAIAAFCETAPVAPQLLTFDFYNLAAGIYYLMVSSNPGAGNELTRFDICVTQGIAPPLISGPPQDCDGAIAVCSNDYIQATSYSGWGNFDELPNYTTCLAGGENNSVWYVFTPQTSGDLAFTIQTTKDYDWALYNLTAIGGCENVPGAVPVLCNYSDDAGNTGTTLPVNATIPRSKAWNQSATMDGIPVIAGTSYALIIDNYTGGANGYELHFNTSGGTATLVDAAVPTITSAVASCTDNTITVNLSEFITCISINPADFSLYNVTYSTPYSNISTVTGVNCLTDELTNQIIITLSSELGSGNYRLSFNAGAFTDKCGNAIAGGNVLFDYLRALTLTPSATITCGATAVTFTTTGAGGPPIATTLTLNPGGYTNNTNGIFTGITPVITTNYTVSANFGCTRSASTIVTAQGNIVTTISPASVTLCSGTKQLDATTTINGVACPSCTYVWSNAATTSSITVGAGTYTVTATSPAPALCQNSNSPSSTITLASSGSGGSTCDVIYVSPTGIAGHGLAKNDPTTLADAVSRAICTNAIVKMQIGLYTLTSSQQIGTNMSIEGGYNVGFTTKSSDMRGETPATVYNSTIIRRTNAGANGTDCSAFVVDDNATQFRIQDIRIELPGSVSVAAHAAGTNRTNYGIKLGASCTSYNIVRCYIDAGVGSAP